VNVVDEWFCSSMEGEIPTMLLNEKALLSDLLKPEQVRQLLNSHKSGQQDNYKLLFSSVMLEQQHNQVTCVQAKKWRPEDPRLAQHQNYKVRSNDHALY